MKRKCGECQARPVCERVCGKLWREFSGDAHGCDHAEVMEGIADSWRRAGWKVVPMGGQPTPKIIAKLLH